MEVTSFCQLMKKFTELVERCTASDERRASMNKYKVVIQRNDGGKTEVVVEAKDKDAAKKCAVKDVEMLYGKCFVLKVIKL